VAASPERGDGPGLGAAASPAGPGGQLLLRVHALRRDDRAAGLALPASSGGISRGADDAGAGHGRFAADPADTRGAAPAAAGRRDAGSRRLLQPVRLRQHHRGPSGGLVFRHALGARGVVRAGGRSGDQGEPEPVALAGDRASGADGRVVVVTANHYWLDSVAAVALLLLAYLVQWQAGRIHRSFLARQPEGRPETPLGPRSARVGVSGTPGAVERQSVTGTGASSSGVPSTGVPSSGASSGGVRSTGVPPTGVTSTGD
jgi:hypothetical protein